jgi:hypothetical protein
MHSTGFEPAILATNLLQTYALDRTANGLGIEVNQPIKINNYYLKDSVVLFTTRSWTSNWKSLVERGVSKM